MDWMGWIYLRSLVLKEHRQSDANNKCTKCAIGKQGSTSLKPATVKLATLENSLPKQTDEHPSINCV